MADTFPAARPDADPIPPVAGIGLRFQHHQCPAFSPEKPGAVP